MPNRRRRSSRLWLVAIAAVLLLGVPSFADFILDWLWFARSDISGVHPRALGSSILGAAVFVVAFLALYAICSWPSRASTHRTRLGPSRERPAAGAAEPATPEPGSRGGSGGRPAAGIGRGQASVSC